MSVARTGAPATFETLGTLLLPLLIFSSAFAQTGTSTVRGTVTDPQGNAVAGATVTLTNAESNFTRTQTTTGDGNYVFTAIPPGTHRVEAESQGFKKTTVSDVRALVDTPIDVSVQLEIGSVSEVVEVSAATEALLNTTDASIGNAVEARRIVELPLNARNIVGLLSLQPGVTRFGEVNGGRRDQANITLDGVDANEQQSGLDIVTGDAFASVLRSTPDSVQEFRVTTSVPNANQGRSSGGQVSLVTRGGTNEFHGSLYHFHRNTVTTSNDFFNNARGRFVATDPEVVSGEKMVGDERLPRPKLLRNIFGGRLGGPIVKDRAFFFYTYEGRRDASEVSVAPRRVPTASLRQGILQYRNTSGGVTTLQPADIARLYPATGGVNPVALAILQTAPLPNDFSVGDGANFAGFRFNAPISVKLNTHIAKFDLNINDRQALFVRGNYQEDLYGQAPQFPTTPSPDLRVNPRGFVVGHTWTLSSNFVNSARVGLTRQGFTQGGDSDQNLVSFRNVYTPFLYSRTLSRTTPVYNITDDVSYSRGDHSIQFGGNLRLIRNNRSSAANSFDTAFVNGSFFAQSGAVLSAPLTGLASAGAGDARDAVGAILGRLSQYSVNVNYDLEGNILPFGTPTKRSFATEEYDVYGQDSWQVRPNLTLTYGLRYGINTPVYERLGYQIQPTTSLGEYYERRVAGAEAGRPVNDLITLDLAGKANNRPGFYQTDYRNFQPSVAVAYSPDFGDSFFGRLLGREGRSVIRGGFRLLGDRVGSALAVNFDLNNALGFSSSQTIPANTFNVTSSPAPLITGLGLDVRSLPRITLPGRLTFPLSAPANEAQRIEQTLDDTITTPRQYTWNLSYGRELPKGFSVEVSYTGRAARDLIAARDIMHLNNLRDPRSGQDWYTAAGILADYRDRRTPISAATPIPYFENLFPGLGDSLLGEPTLTATQAVYTLVARPEQDGFDIIDWTYIQSDDLLDNLSTVVGPNAFFHPQYAALGTYSTIGYSNYHGGSISLRQRFKDSFLFDFNYTLSKAMDTGSTLEAGLPGSGGNSFLSGLIVNPLDIRRSYGPSDFDIRHNFNVNFLAELPFGRDRKFLNDLPGALNAILGGFQLTGIFRYHTGQPFDVGTSNVLWATNWNITSNPVRLRDIQADNNPNLTINDPRFSGRPNAFSDPNAAYRSLRDARAGEVGDRNYLRLPNYFVIDAGLSKSFQMPYAETHRLQFRWEVFNVTNTQPLGSFDTLSVIQDPANATSARSGFGVYTGSQTPIGESRPGRVMQFALRYEF